MTNAIPILFIGGTNVGKTCIIHRIETGRFLEPNVNTITPAYHTICKNFDGNDHAFQLRDTAGQERFRSLTSKFFHDSKTVIIIYSVVDKHSFEDVESWYKLANREIDDPLFFLVANKIDLQDEIVVFKEDGIQKAQELKIPPENFFEVSALSGDNFEFFDNILKKSIPVTIPRPEPRTVKVSEAGAKTGGEKGGCC